MMLAVLFGRAATVTFTMTNSVGNPDTNSILIQPIASSINADGSVQTAGLPFRIYPNTGGIVSTNLQGGNYLATNAFICSQYVGPGNFGTSQGIIFAVPNSSGTYPFGQLAISGYNVFNYNGASFVVTASNIFAAIGYTPLTPQQVTNLFLLCNTNIYQASTNIVFVLSNGITLVTAPPQGFLTNGLVDRTITNGLATTNYASMTASNIAAIYTTTNQFTWGTNWVYTNWIAQLNLFGSSSTNFTVGASNSLAANGLAQLQATNTSLTAAIIASNAAQASALQAATNSLWANKQQSNGVLTSLAGGLAWTNLNFGLLPGTNFSFATNLSTGQVTLAVPTQWWLTNLLSTMAYTPTNWYLPTNALPALTNGFITSSALTPYLLSATAALTYYPLSNPSNFVGNSVTNGLATTNYVLGVIVASNANFVTFAQVQSSNTLAILTAATLGTNFGYQIGTGATNYANGVGTAVTNDVMAASNNVLTTATAQLNGTNANTLNVATNLVAALQARAVTNTQASVSFSAIGPVTGSLAVTIGGGSISGAFGTLNAGGLTTGGGTLGALGYLGLGWITNATYAVLASNLVNAGLLAYSNNITSNNLAGKINVGQVFGAAGTNGFLPTTNAFAQNQFGFGARTNFLVTTNIIGILGGGSSTEGTYLGINLNMTWTNYFNPAFAILASGGNYFLMSNAVTLYSSPDLVNWSIVSGVAPVPTGFFGTKWHMTGTLMDGWMIPTNIYQSFAGVVTGNITNLQFSAAGLGTIEGLPFSGLVGGTMTNTFFTAAGSNYIASVVLLLAENPTNGISSTTASNIVANYGSTLYIQNQNGFGTNTFLTNGIVLAATNFNVLGVGPRAGEISFAHGDIIQELSFANNNAANDSGLTFGIGNGQMFQEQFSIVGGATNDVAGSLGIECTGNTIWGGVNNVISDAAHLVNFAGIFGGMSNAVARGSFSTVIGGYSNYIGQAAESIILGGASNSIDAGGSIGSTVGGLNAHVVNSDDFLWNDGTTSLASTANDQFLVQATGGAEFFNTPVDSTVGFTVNGLPVSSTPQSGLYISQLYGIGTNITVFLTNVISGTYFLQSASQTPALPRLIASGATGTNAFLNGPYQSATNDNSYFTNIAGNNFIIATPTTTGTPFAGFYLITNFTLFNGVDWKNAINLQNIPHWANNSIVGIYNGSTAIGNVQIAFSTFTPTTTSVAVSTNNAGTNTLYVFGSEKVNGDLIATNLIAPAQNITGYLPTMTNGLNANISIMTIWGSGAMSTNANFYPKGIDGTGQTGTNNWGFFRIAYTNYSGFTKSGIRFVFANNPPVTIGGSSSANATNAITVSAALEYPVGTFTRMTFNGSNSVIINTNQFAVVSDPCWTVTLTNLATYQARIWVVAPTNCGFPTSQLLDQFGGTADGELLGNTGFDATITATALSTAQVFGYGPYAILGQTVGAASSIGSQSVFNIGDSRSLQANGWLYARLGGMNIPIVFGAQGGNSFELETNVMIWDVPAALATCTTISDQLGVNSIYGNNDTFQTLTNVFAGSIAKYVAAGKRIVVWTIPPYTSSSDGWTTLANQTLQTSTGGGNSVRVQWNDWVRAGCPGVPGVSAYIEMADALESQRNSGFWRVDLGAVTGDGLHANTLGVNTLIANLDLTPLIGRIQPLYQLTPTNPTVSAAYSATPQVRPGAYGLETSNLTVILDDRDVTGGGIAGNKISFQMHSGGSAFEVTGSGAVNFNNGFGIAVNGTVSPVGGIIENGSSGEGIVAANSHKIWLASQTQAAPDIGITNQLVYIASPVITPNILTLSNSANTLGGGISPLGMTNTGSAYIGRLAMTTIPAGAAPGWMFTLTNITTGEGTWSNAPAGGGANAVVTNAAGAVSAPVNFVNPSNNIAGSTATFTNISAAQGGSFSGNGTGLTNLNAANLTTNPPTLGPITVPFSNNRQVLTTGSSSTGFNISSRNDGLGDFYATRFDFGFEWASTIAWFKSTTFIATGSIIATNGFLSSASNLLAPSSITFPATGAFWTNTTGRNISVYIDNTGVTGTTVSINGSQVYSSLVGDGRVDLEPGEYFSEVYTVGTPTAKIKPQ